MKGSINPGGIKDASESLLRVFSGSPRCALVGSLDIVYDLDIIYNANGTMGIHYHSGNPDRPFGFPFGQWELQTTLQINNPVPMTGIIGMSEDTSGNGTVHVGGRFLIDPTIWDRVFIQQPGLLPHLANAGEFWFPPGTNVSGLGPDLLNLASLDFGSSGNTVAKRILPPQNEVCLYQFIPYLRTPSFVFPFGKDCWSPSTPPSRQTFGWDIQGLAPALYPDNTAIGTLQFRFRRISNTPLFQFRLVPPRTFVFTNLSLFNPGLAPTWDWDFGDGSAHGNTINTIHSYAGSGTYVTKLSSTDAAGTTKHFDQLVLLPLIADFTYTTRQAFHFIPVTQVLPVDKSVGEVTWDWDWGDGSAHSTTQVIPFPGHEYPRNQTFTITLTVGDGTGKTTPKSVVINT